MRKPFATKQGVGRGRGYRTPRKRRIATLTVEMSDLSERAQALEDAGHHDAAREIHEQIALMKCEQDYHRSFLIGSDTPFLRKGRKFNAVYSNDHTLLDPEND